MISFGYTLALTALTAVYALFLMRIRAGIGSVAEEASEQRARAEDAEEELLPEVSIILPVRNEERHVAACLESLLRQQYPAERCEILVVEDASEDATRSEVARIAAADRRVTLIDAPEQMGGGGKKRLIARAMERARGAIILTTDADCRHPACWLRAMASRFNEGVNFVSGPVVYEGGETLQGRLLALEFLGLVGIGAGFIGIGYPRLCNGANIAFRASSFRAVGGYASNDGVASGDDEFLMQKIASLQGGVIFLPHPDAVVRTAPPGSAGAFLEQRKRWASKGLRYADKRFVAFLVLLFLYFLHLLAAPIVALTSAAAALAILLLLAVKAAADAALLVSSARLLIRPLRFGDIFIGELLHVPYILLAALAGTFSSYRWKGRRLTA